ncbi:MAG: hypothetical protein IT363_02255 [Methanoregulaceae archaeon]|nr:hypothetical protein [Methanoregulaceae archaeon]
MAIVPIPDAVLNAEPKGARTEQTTPSPAQTPKPQPKQPPRDYTDWFVRIVGAVFLFAVTYLFASSSPVGLSNTVCFCLASAVAGAFLWKGGSLWTWLLNVIGHTA